MRWNNPGKRNQRSDKQQAQSYTPANVFAGTDERNYQCVARQHLPYLGAFWHFTLQERLLRQLAPATRSPREWAQL